MDMIEISAFSYWLQEFYMLFTSLYPKMSDVFS